MKNIWRNLLLLTISGIAAYKINSAKLDCNQRVVVGYDEIYIDEPYDYCKICESSDNVSRVLAGTPVHAEVIMESDIEKIENHVIEVNDIVDVIGKDGYQVVLVPVGYSTEEVPNVMGSFVEKLDKLYEGVNVNFSYLDSSIDVGLQHIDRFPSLIDNDEIDVLADKINDIHRCDGIVVVYNTDYRMGCGGKYVVVSGECFDNLYVITHEIGHNLGLVDGYERYYGENGLNGSELFLSLDELSDIKSDAYKKVKPEIVDTGNVCGEYKVFTFYEDGSGDIMDNWFSNEDMLKMIEEGKSPFNPLQIEIMNSYIDKCVD